MENIWLKMTINQQHHHNNNRRICWGLSSYGSKLLKFSVTFYLILAIGHAKPNRPLLRGVTFRNWPYADRINDRYEGFVVDLMNLIASMVGFEYRLYFSPDGKYGTEFNGHINGMIGEVFRNRADFAIADLTVTESRKRYVDFTDAFLENQLAAIIRRDDAVGLRTLEDLVTLNEINHRPDLPPTERRGLLTYGTYRTGATYYHLSKNKDPIAKKIYEWMVRNPDALVTSAKEGFDRVNAGRYAFIVESTFAEYLTGIYCNLTMLYDTRSLYPRKFAIALPKGSPYVYAFNKAIRELKASGTIQRLRRKYWENRCNHRDNGGDHLMAPPSLAPTPQTPSTPPSSSSPSPSSLLDNKSKEIIINKNNNNNNNNNDDDQLIGPSNNGNNDNNNNNNNNNDQSSENGKNNAANAIKIEWASHNHHNNAHHYPQAPPALPSSSSQSYPHQIDRNRNTPPFIHHRINNHPHHHPHQQTPITNSRNNNRMNQPQDYDLDEMYYSRDPSRRRTSNGVTSMYQSLSLSSICLSTILPTIFWLFLLSTPTTTTITSTIATMFHR